MNKLISFDFAIKYLLKDKGNYDIVEGFISSLLKEQGYKPVKILALLDAESNKEEYSQKKSIADLIVEDEQHTKYIIEIERQYISNFIHKSCFNTSRLLVDQVSSGVDYTNIKKIFHISLLYFKVGSGPIYHGKTVIREAESQEKLIVHIEDENHHVYDATEIFPEYIFISVPKFNDIVNKEIDEWLYVMKHAEIKPEFKSPYMKKVAEKLNILKMTNEMRDEYFNYMNNVTTYQDAIDSATAKGLAKGKAEGKAEIAKRMLAEKLAIELIAKVTELTAEEIGKLK